MMKGYSKIRIINSTSSKAMEDDSDLLESLEPTRTNSTSSSDDTRTDQTHEEKKPNKKNESQAGLQEETEEGGMFDMKLKRNSSVSSAYALHSAMKKAFSIRRSSSVSERYCRIHDQSVALPSPTHDHEEDHPDGDMDSRTRPMKRRNGRGRLLRACKKILGF